MNSNKQKTIMDIPRFPAPECFRKDEKKTRNISNRVSVWVNFSVKNHKENECFFSSRFARLAVSILSNSRDEFTQERSDPRTHRVQWKKLCLIILSGILHSTRYVDLLSCFDSLYLLTGPVTRIPILLSKLLKSY